MSQSDPNHALETDLGDAARPSAAQRERYAASPYER
jgi:hypothetical protein